VSSPILSLRFHALFGAIRMQFPGNFASGLTKYRNLFYYSANERKNLARRIVAIDNTDRRILAQLQIAGRIPNAELAERVNLSASACHRRTRRLEAEGYIKSYVALLDARRMGCASTVFVEITLQGQTDDVLEAFEKEVSKIPDVLECHLMAGKSDYLLKVVARDTEDFSRIHRRYLARLPGVMRMHSSFALRTVRKTTALPL